jgi:hypothetical protein
MIISVFKDKNQRWHWCEHITTFENSQASQGIPGEGCCVNKRGFCEGFENKIEAEKAGKAFGYEEHRIE